MRCRWDRQNEKDKNGTAELEKFFGKIYQHVKIALDVETGEGRYTFVD